MAEVSQALQDYDDIAMGQDFGFNHANAILLLGWKDGDVYVLRELYVYDVNVNEYLSHVRISI